MKLVVEAYTTLLILMLNIFICIAVSNASASVAEAKEYKADVVAEIENSNFNPNVIANCIVQAEEAGYELQITNCIFDDNNDIQTAEIILSYTYQIPLFGISETKTTRGIAR